MFVLQSDRTVCLQSAGGMHDKLDSQYAKVIHIMQNVTLTNHHKYEVIEL